MRRLLARVLYMRHLLRDALRGNGPTKEQEQETHDRVSRSNKRGLRQTSASSDRQQRRQPQPDQAGRRRVQLPTFGTRVQTVEVSTEARREQKRAEPFGLYVVLLGVNLITLALILSIPSPPPLPQPHDCPTSEAWN